MDSRKPVLSLTANVFVYSVRILIEKKKNLEFSLKLKPLITKLLYEFFIPLNFYINNKILVV